MFINIAGLHDQTAGFVAAYFAAPTPRHQFGPFDRAGHMVASLVSFVPAARPVQLALNPMVLGTTTFRVLGQLKSGEGINHDDILTLASDAAGVVAVVAVVVGATTTAGVAIAVGATVTAYQILDSRFGLWDAFKIAAKNEILTYHPSPDVYFSDLNYGYYGYFTQYRSINQQNPGIAKVIVTHPDGTQTVTVQPRYDPISADPYPNPGLIPAWDISGCATYLILRNWCDRDGPEYYN
jgi:hypothetical protein